MENFNNKDKYPQIVKTWLMIGLIMVFFQIVIGGITRLTGSGLSITKWDIITGTIPPLNETDWLAEFDLYKATPQYKKINQGMSLNDFKFIYFWEYIHRLWARTMGFVFLIPFLVFWWRKWIDKGLAKRLGVVVALAALAASFGWIMVASGLIDRPWVNAYKLAMHLSIGFSVFIALWWVYLYANPQLSTVIHNLKLKKWTIGIISVICLQLFMGGLVSGMKAGLYLNDWPYMGGQLIPSVLTTGSEWKLAHLMEYDTNIFAPVLVQFIHRSIAYLLVFSGLYYFFTFKSVSNSKSFTYGMYVFVTLLFTQVLLGIFTLINCIGGIPLALGVLHQGVGILFLASAVFLLYPQLKKANNL